MIRPDDSLPTTVPVDRSALDALRDAVEVADLATYVTAERRHAALVKVHEAARELLQSVRR